MTSQEPQGTDELSAAITKFLAANPTRGPGLLSQVVHESLYGDVLENEPATATAQRPVKSALPLPKPAKGKKILPKQQQPAAHAAAAATKSESARSGVDSILDKFFPRDKEYSELLATPTPPSRKRKVAASASDSSLAPVPSTQGKRTKLVDTASADFSPTPLPKASRGKTPTSAAKGTAVKTPTSAAKDTAVKTPTSTKKSYMWDALSSGEVSPTDQGPKRASASEKVFSVATPTRASVEDEKMELLLDQVAQTGLNAPTRGRKKTGKK